MNANKRIIKRIVFPQFFCALRRINCGKDSLFALIGVISGLMFFPLVFSVQAQTPYYHLNRSFSSIEFDLQGIPTEYQLNEESDKLTDIVKGEPVQLNTNETYAIEKQAAIPICYGSAIAAWNAALAYNGSQSNYPGKTFDNVGWVRGTKNTGSDWGAYLWILQNRIVFQSSTSVWWIATNNLPVAITNVMVGSLGDYGPVSNVVDIGPVIPTNFPGANYNYSGTYQVDITNVFYELVIPDIWITPREAVTCVDGSNVQYTVTGTNIPKGVTWKIIPEGVGATIQTNGDWYHAEVTPGDVATNYKVRATSVDNTNFYDEVDLAVVGLQSLQYKIGTNSWTNMPDPLYVCSNTIVDFKAIKIPTNTTWPSGKPVWGGVVSGSEVETNSYTFNTISTSTTDYKLVTAECGNAVTGKVIVCNIHSETEATVPANRARTQVGVGEQVDITTTPELQTVTWSVSGGGSLDSTDDVSTIFTAPDTVANCLITANFEGNYFTKEFSVLAPTGIVSAQIESTTHFDLGYAAARMHLYPIIIGPTNVSFYNVQCVEVGTDASNITGYFLTNTPPSHIGNGADEWFQLDQANAWPDTWDWASSYGWPSPWSSGSYTWDIPAQWKVVGSSETNSMTGWNQVHSIDANGTVTVQKFGHNVTRTTNDVITTY